MRKLFDKIFYAIGTSYEEGQKLNQGQPWYMQTPRKNPLMGIILICSAALFMVTYLGFNYLAKVTAKPKTVQLQLSHPVENSSFKSDATNKSFSLESSESKYKGIIFSCDLTSGHGIARTLNDELSCELTKCNELMKSLNNPAILFDFNIDKTNVSCNF